MDTYQCRIVTDKDTKVYQTIGTFPGYNRKKIIESQHLFKR